MNWELSWLKYESPFFFKLHKLLLISPYFHEIVSASVLLECSHCMFKLWPLLLKVTLQSGSRQSFDIEQETDRISAILSNTYLQKCPLDVSKKWISWHSRSNKSMLLAKRRGLTLVSNTMQTFVVTALSFGAFSITAVLICSSTMPPHFSFSFSYLESFLLTFWRHCASFLICLWECHSRNARGADLVPSVLSSHNTRFEVTQNVQLIILSLLLSCQYIQACTVSRSHSPLSGTCRSCHSPIHLYYDPPKRKLCPLAGAILLLFEQSLSLFCCKHQLQEWKVSGALMWIPCRSSCPAHASSSTSAGSCLAFSQ